MATDSLLSICGTLGLFFIIFLITNIVQYWDLRRMRSKIKKLSQEIVILEWPTVETKTKSEERNTRTSGGAGERGSVFLRYANGSKKEVQVPSLEEKIISRVRYFNHTFNDLPVHSDVTFGKWELKEVIDITEEIVRETTHWNHPGYLGRPWQGGTICNIIAQEIATLSNAKNDQKLLSLAMNWAKMATGIPDEFQGIFVESVAEGHFLALVTGRERKREIEMAKTTNKSFSVYASSQAHPFLPRSAKLALLHLRRLPVLSADLLEKQLQKDISEGVVPAVIVVTLGSYGTMSSDPLEELAILAEKYNCWLHVDAFGEGFFWLDPRNRRNGLKKADSIVLEMAFMGTDIVWMKNKEEWEKSVGFQQFDSLLNSLKMIITTGIMGTQKMINEMDRLISLTIRLEQYVAKHQNLRIVSPRILNSFSFQYFEPNLSPSQLSFYSNELLRLLNASNWIILGGRKVNGSVFLVATISSHRTTEKTIDVLWKTVEEIVQRFAIQKSVERALGKKMENNNVLEEE